MTDRLPTPLLDDAGDAPLVERASATTARAIAFARERERGPAEGRASAQPWTSLRELQERMVDAITGSDASAADAALRLTPGPRLTARERLEIYRFGYRARLVECLDDDYPILARTIGEAAFENLANQYIERFPSKHPNLNAFGRNMAALCKDAELGALDSPSGDFPGSSARDFLSELAALEWALVECIHAKEPESFELAVLQAIPVERWATARLVRSDTVRVLRFAYPVNAFYQACRGRDEYPEIPEPKATATAVYRRAWRLWRLDLTPAMERVLTALLDGVPIEESLGRMGVDEADPEALAEAERSVMIWFKEWMQGGFFGGVELAAHG
jgi:hypothetical protein